MLPLQNLASERPLLSFSLHGLPAREELLFKSLVRLLSHRTLQNWFYDPLAAHLKVVADGASKTLSESVSVHASQILGAAHVLTLGVVGANRESFLCLPLRAEELEAELNRVGTLLTRGAPKIAVASDRRGPAASLADTDQDLLRLQRWPPADLLKSSPRIRMATLLTGKPVTLQILQQRSGQPLALCADFVEELKLAGLLVIEGPHADAAEEGHNHPAAGPVKEQPSPLGFLARIRSRLGLSIGGHK